MARPTLRALLPLLPLALGACGREAERPSTTTPMTPGELHAEVPVDSDEMPALAGVRFEPEVPFAGRTARAVVDRGAVPPSIRLEYRFEIDGREAPSERDHVDLAGSRPDQRLEVTVTPFVDETAGQPVRHAVRLRAPAPRVLGVSFEPTGTVIAGDRLHARPIVEDGDPRSMSHRFEWLVDGRRQAVYEDVFSTEGLRRGATIQVEVIVSSDGLTSEPYLSEPVPLENGAPVLQTTPLAFDDEGNLDVRLEARDPDGDTPVQFALLSGPTGAELSRDGHLRWPAAADHPGHHPLEIELRDPLGATRKSRFAIDIGSPASAAP